MFSFLPWSWRRRRPEDPPGAGGRGALPEEFSTQSRHRRPGQGWAWLWRQDGMRHSRGAGDTGRDAGIAGEAGEAGDGPGCAQVNGKEPGRLRNGGGRQEQAEVRSSPSGIQTLGKDFGDKAGVPRQGRNGNVPRERTDRPRRRAPQPPRAGKCEDEEGEPSSNSQSQDTNSALRNGNVPREGTDQPLCLPSLWVVSREDEEGKPSSNSQSREKDTATATRDGNVPREGMDRPPPPLPPRAGKREDEEGEPSSNSQSQDTNSATQNGNVPREGMDQPVFLPTFWVVSREDEEGKPSSNSQSREKDTATATRNGNVPREGMDRPPPPLPSRAGNREDEEGKPSSNSQSQDTNSALRNGNMPREGMDQPLCLPSLWVVSREDEEGKPSSNSRSREKDTATATRDGNVPREGMDRPPPPLPSRAGNREDEEGKPSSNSQSQDTNSATQNGNVPREGMDQPVILPTFWVVSREDEEGKPSSNSRSRDTDSALRDGNVPRERTDRPRRRAPQPPRAGKCEDEEGEPSSNSQSWEKVMDKDKDTATATRNGNVPREGTDQPLCLPSLWVVSREDEEGEPSGNSRSGDTDSALPNGNVLREGTDQPVILPTLWAVSREDEEGEPSNNSRSRDTDSALRDGNVPREGMDRPPLPPRAGNREDEEGKPSSNSQSQDTNSATQNGNMPREGMDQPVFLPTFWAVSREDEEGEPSGNSQSREKDTATATRNGNVPREGTDQPVFLPTFWVVSREDEEGEPSNNSRSQGRDTDAATTPGRDRRTEPPSGAECREWLCQRLRELGEDMEGWEGKPTAELAAGLARRIAGTPLGSYPAGPGTRSARPERGSGACLDHGVPSGIYRSLLGMLRASGSSESAEEGSGLGSGSGSGSGSDREQSSGASPDRDIPSVNYGSLLRMLRAGGNAESAEEDSGLEQSSAASPDHGVPGRNYGCFIGMLRASGSAENAEGDSGSEREQAAVKVGREWDPGRLDRRFQEVWARSRLDCGRVAKEEKLDGDPVPFQRQRQLRPHKEQQMAELLEEYLQERIVVEGTSESNNSLILYKKRHGRGTYLSLDCAALNAATPVAPQEPLDRDGILTSINPRCRFFTVLDLSNACLAIPLAPSCWGRFAFTFRGQQFLFTRLPPTFHGTGSILHRRVAAMLAELEPGAARGVFQYYDDILIAGKRRRQVRYRTRRVLELIQKTGFKVNRDKAQLVQTEVNYLGLIVGASGRRVPPEKLQQICGDCDADGPWDPTRLRSVLGKFEDLKEFIPDYLELALPLQRLAAPGKWEWEREREWQREWERERGRDQLRRLKEALKAAPALLFPNKPRPFAIRLSVHEQTVGAVLLQEKAGALLPVRHWSRRLSGQGWAPRDASCLAAVWAVQAFQKLTGPAPILIQGPAGRYLLRGEPLLDGCAGDPELPERWRLLVTTKGPEKKESQPVSIPLAPELRQLPPDVPNANIWFLAVEKGWSSQPAVAFAAANLEDRWLLGLRQGREEEEEALLEALWELLEHHRSSRPLFLYSSWPRLAARLRRLEPDWRYGDTAGHKVLRWLRSFPGMLHVCQVGTRGDAAPDERRWMQTVTARARAEAENSPAGRWNYAVWEPSASERQEIVAQCHRHRHDGVAGTLARVRNVRSWGNDGEDVTRWVRRCPECRDGDPDPDRDPAPQREEGPWSRLRISLSSSLPVSPEGFRALLLVQDELSGWLDAFPLRRPAQPEVSQALLREVFGRFGKVEAVLLEPEPAWLWELLWRPPLLGRRGRLEVTEVAEAARGAVRVARALGAGWAAALPLIRAGIAAQWVREEELGALLCVPQLPLEVRWEHPGCGRWDWRGDGKENEIARLRPMKIQPGYRHQVQNALW